MFRPIAPVGPVLVAFRPAGLAVDPTLKGDQTTAIVISVVYPWSTGVAPFPWPGASTGPPSAGPMDPMVELLRELAPAVPKEMTVIVLCDRGIASPKDRYAPRAGRERHLLRPRRPPVATAWIGRMEVHRHPVGGLVRRAVRTLDHPHRPATGGRRTQLVRPALLDRTGLQGRQKLGLEVGQKDRSGADLPPLAGVVGGDAAGPGLGTRVEDAHDPGLPQATCARPKTPVTPGAGVGPQRQRHHWLRRLLLRGRLWSRVWLLPEPSWRLLDLREKLHTLVSERRRGRPQAMEVHRRGLVLAQVKGRRVRRAGCFRPRMAERGCVAERSGAQAPEDLQLVQVPDGRVGRVGHGSPAGVSTSVISGCPDRRHQPRPWIGSAGRSPGISKASSAQTMKLREERVASVVFLDVSVALAFAAAGGGEPAPRPPLSLSLVSQPGRLPPLRWPTPRRHLSGPLCWIRPQLPDCRRRRLRRRKSHRPRRQRRARLPCRLRPPGRPPRRPRSPRRPPH